MKKIFTCILFVILFSGFTIRTSGDLEGDMNFQNKENIFFSNDNFSVSNLYPNPANEVTRVAYSMKEDVNLKISIHNILGGIASEVALPSDKKEVSISTEKMDSGIYFYTLYHEGKVVATKKLIIKH
jgi:hypothetical protein